MTTFVETVRDMSNGQAIYFDSLEVGERMALVGLYLAENYKGDDSYEPFSEAMTPDLAARFFAIMADSPETSSTTTQWVAELAYALIGRYSGIVQGAIDEALEPPYWADDGDAAIQRMGVER